MTTVASMGTGRYLGGLPGQFREVRGRVWATDEGIGVGDMGPTDLLIPLTDIATVEVETVAVAKSKLPAALAFGVVGALVARGSEDKVAVTVTLRSGAVAYFRCDFLGLPFVQGMVGPWITEHGLAPGAAAVAEPGDLAPQLERLAALHLSGALTDDEFADAKRRVLIS